MLETNEFIDQIIEARARSQIDFVRRLRRVRDSVAGVFPGESVYDRYGELVSAELMRERCVAVVEEILEALQRDATHAKGGQRTSSSSSSSG